MLFQGILAIVTLSFSTLITAVNVDVVYYPVSDFNCERAGRAITIKNATTDHCYNLEHATQAFKFGTAANKEQFSHDENGFGCGFNGWADRGCPGQNVIYAVPSNLNYAATTKFGMCYPSTYSTAIKSFKIFCGP